MRVDWKSTFDVTWIDSGRRWIAVVLVVVLFCCLVVDCFLFGLGFAGKIYPKCPERIVYLYTYIWVVLGR